MRPDHLDEALGRSRARVLIVQPLYQNPAGACLSADRHAEIRAVARRGSVPALRVRTAGPRWRETTGGPHDIGKALESRRLEGDAG